MNPKTLAVLGAAALVALAVAGCTLSQSEARKEPLLQGLGGGNGQSIEPKRCALTVWVIPGLLGDKVINGAVWSSADEQSIGPESLRALRANGLRVGVIEGTLPADVDAALHAPPPHQINPAEFALPDGDDTLIALSDSVPQATLLLNRDGRASGKDYADASGWFRVTANQAGPTGVSLRLVPEIHHGPIQRRFDATAANASSLNPMQFTLKDGQQEETLRDLAATLTLQPGQTAIIGADPDLRGGLGSFFFTHTEANSDRLTQRLVLIRASRTNVGVAGSQPNLPTRLDPVEPPDLPPLPARKAEAR